jgi:hypothetical protein
MQTIQFPSEKAFDTVMNAFSIMLTSLKNDDAKIAVVHRVLGSLPADKLFEFEKQVVRMCDVLRGDDGTEVKAVRINTAVLDTYKKEQEELDDEEKRKIAKNILLRQEALQAKKKAEEKEKKRVAKRAAKVLAAKQELEEAQRKVAAARLDSDDEDEFVDARLGSDDEDKFVDARLGSDDEDKFVDAKVVDGLRILMARPYQSVTIKPTAAVLEETKITKRVKFVEKTETTTPVVVEVFEKRWAKTQIEFNTFAGKGLKMCDVGERCGKFDCADIHVKTKVHKTSESCGCGKIHVKP